MSTPIFKWLLLIWPISSRRLWITDIPVLNWRWKTTFPSRANYSWVLTLLITEYYLEHWNTNQRGSQLSKHTLLLFLIPSDSEGFFSLWWSLSGEKVCGKVWSPIAFTPLPSPGTQLDMWWDRPPRGSTERHSLMQKFRFQTMVLSLKTQPQATPSYTASHPITRQQGITDEMIFQDPPRTDKSLIPWFTNG